MTTPNRPPQAPPAQTRDEGQQAARDNTQPWDYQRHLEADHNLLVDAQDGWPTAVRRYRLFRPMQGKKTEKTLVAFTGNAPEALAYFFRYIHPSAAAKTGNRPPVWRRS